MKHTDFNLNEGDVIRLKEQVRKPMPEARWFSLRGHELVEYWHTGTIDFVCFFEEDGFTQKNFIDHYTSQMDYGSLVQFQLKNSDASRVISSDTGPNGGRFTSVELVKKNNDSVTELSNDSSNTIRCENSTSFAKVPHVDLVSPIETRYSTHAAMLGAPIHNERRCADNVGSYRTYERGSIFHHPSVGAWEVHGGIRDLWFELGAENGFLGYPAFDEQDYFDRQYISDRPSFRKEAVGRCSLFQGGCIAWFSDRSLAPSGVELQRGEFMVCARTWPDLLDRPISNITMTPIRTFTPERLSEKTKSLIKMEFITNIRHIQLKDIPSDYGRSLYSEAVRKGP